MSEKIYPRKIMLMSLPRTLRTEEIRKLIESWGEIAHLTHAVQMGTADIYLESNENVDEVAKKLQSAKLGGESFSVFVKNGEFKLPQAPALVRFKKEIDEFLEVKETWPVKYLESVGPLKFGMSSEDAARALKVSFQPETWDGKIGITASTKRNTSEYRICKVLEAPEVRKRKLEIFQKLIPHMTLHDDTPFYESMLNESGLKLLFDSADKLQAVGFLASSISPEAESKRLIGLHSNDWQSFHQGDFSRADSLHSLYIDGRKGTIIDRKCLTLTEEYLNNEFIFLAWIYSEQFKIQFLYEAPAPKVVPLIEKRYQEILAAKEIQILSKEAFEVIATEEDDPKLEQKLRVAGSKMFGPNAIPKEKRRKCKSCNQSFSLIIQFHTNDIGDYVHEKTPSGALQLSGCLNDDCEFEWDEKVAKNYYDIQLVPQKDLESEGNETLAKVGYKKLEFQPIKDLPPSIPEEILNQVGKKEEIEPFELADANRSSCWDAIIKVGGYPNLVQGGLPGYCSQCKSRKNLKFIFQLPESHGDDLLNFASGLGYVYQCQKHPEVFSFGIQYS